MPVFSVKIADDASDALGKIGPNARAALTKALDPVKASLTHDVRATALGHIHTFNAKSATVGGYLASIYGGVSEKDTRISVYVRSGHPLAHLLEYGASTPAHDILPKAAKILAFLYGKLGGDAERFARKVHHPGAVIPPYPAFGPVFAARQAEVERVLTDTVAASAQNTKG
jgi:hypothetical protein